MPWYRIESRTRPDLPGQFNLSRFGYVILLPREFPDFVRSLEFDQEVYEEISADSLRAHGFKESIWDRPSCLWDGGILWAIRVPGNAAGLSMNLSGIDSPAYSFDNMDTPNQRSVTFDVVTHYLREVQERYFETLR